MRRFSSQFSECLFAFFGCLKLPEAHTRPSAILVDEFDPGASQHRFNRRERCRITGIPADLNIADRVPMQAGPCRSPAVRGKKRCRMHGGAPGSGAPRGNKNAFKQGFILAKQLANAARFRTWCDTRARFCVILGDQLHLPTPALPKLEHTRHRG